MAVKWFNVESKVTINLNIGLPENMHGDGEKEKAIEVAIENLTKLLSHFPFATSIDKKSINATSIESRKTI